MIEKQLIHSLLARIKKGGVKIMYWDGTSVTYGPDKPYATIHFKDRRAVRAMMRNFTLGFGEAYMNGLIDVDGPLDQLGRLASENSSAFKTLAANRLTHLRNRNIRKNQQTQVSHHYDLGNDFYKLWLDKSMTYSCAYFKTPNDTLEQAQSQKVEHLLKKLQLQKGQSLLDIGSGWGTLLITAAKEYDVKGHGITLSREQYEHCVQRAKEEGLEKQLKFELINYRDLAERDLKFDRIVSVGMFEHVGRRNHGSYFDAVQKMLAPGGISVLHSITNEVENSPDPWIDKYIFPGGYIPSIREVVHELPAHDFHLFDYENLRIHYAMTLDEWLRRFDQNHDKIYKKYDDRFMRMWRLYLASSSAGFRYGDLSLSQFVFTKGLNNNLPLTREFLYTKSK
jgi:cyclopropane-fatty-acyl-phospholipid synthase